MAEHMLISGVSVKGQKTYVAAAFPSACGKTNFAMLIPPEKYRKDGWKITTVGDDIAWMWVDEKTGRLRAINPEAGYFGVVPGTNEQTNPNAMACMSHDTIFTNVALLPDGDVWWEGKTAEPPAECIDWTGKPWTPKMRHARPRIPTADSPRRWRTTRRWIECADDPNGVEISAIIFGGRRAKTIAAGLPGVQLDSWRLRRRHARQRNHRRRQRGRSASSAAIRWRCFRSLATTSAITSSIGSACERRWRIARASSTSTGSARTSKGEFIWPGFGENIRVLKWIVDRCHGRAYAVETPTRLDAAPAGHRSLRPEHFRGRIRCHAERRSGSVQSRDSRPGRTVPQARRRSAQGDDFPAGVADQPIVTGHDHV